MQRKNSELDVPIQLTTMCLHFACEAFKLIKSLHQNNLIFYYLLNSKWFWQIRETIRLLLQWACAWWHTISGADKSEICASVNFYQREYWGMARSSQGLRHFLTSFWHYKWWLKYRSSVRGFWQWKLMEGRGLWLTEPFSIRIPWENMGTPGFHIGTCITVLLN